MKKRQDIFHYRIYIYIYKLKGQHATQRKNRREKDFKSACLGTEWMSEVDSTHSINAEIKKNKKRVVLINAGRFLVRRDPRD